MISIWFYTLISVFIVSLISLIGIFTLAIKIEKLKTIVIYLVSFSAGALFGDAFIHLLPETAKQNGLGITFAVSILAGILIFFILEKILHWQHCHMPITKHHVHPFAIMNLIGDSVHNFIDGAIIAASYIVSFPVGIATTLAVLFHEIPQEMGDFGVLIHGGFSKKKALLVNFLTALTAIIGAAATLIIGNYITNLNAFLIPLAIGGFIYIAGSDLIPELHKETEFKKSFLQIIFFIIGILIMAALLLIG
jgi:zinc and cadmium transporter